MIAGQCFNESSFQVLVTLLGYPAAVDLVPGSGGKEDKAGIGKEITYPRYAPQPWESPVSSVRFLYQLRSGSSFLCRIKEDKTQERI